MNESVLSAVVTTTHGPVRGRVADGVTSFKGIRYGADTAAHRFEPPRAPAPWTETVNAFEFGPTAPQDHPDEAVDRADNPFLRMIGLTDNLPESEDCLFVNVWTPGTTARARDAGRLATPRPVLVWVHSGGYSDNSGSSPSIDGAALAERHDLVVVTFNHRLNVLGYMQVVAPTAEPGSPYAVSGNVGQLDIVAALEWVRDNIAAFGGDPGSVTLAGQSGGDRPLHGTSVHAVDQIGYLNLMHAERIAVLGLRELDYYRKLDRHRRDRLHQTLLAARPPALIISDGQEAPSALVDFCNHSRLPLLGCPLAAGPLIETLEQALAHKDHTSMHGVLMDVLGMGVLITGDSGLGKSELALELISRGHGLVADDVVDIERVSQHAIVGRCPALLQGLLEVRGLGLIDIRTIFGESAVRRRMPIKLIVHLVGRRTMEDSYERLPLQALTETILGIPVRKVAIPVAAGRNIAVLTETAVRTTVLLLRGIDTTREFTRHQQALILRVRSKILFDSIR